MRTEKTHVREAFQARVAGGRPRGRIQGPDGETIPPRGPESTSGAVWSSLLKLLAPRPDPGPAVDDDDDDMRKKTMKFNLFVSTLDRSNWGCHGNRKLIEVFNDFYVCGCVCVKFFNCCSDFFFFLKNVELWVNYQYVIFFFCWNAALDVLKFNICVFFFPLNMSGNTKSTYCWNVEWYFCNFLYLLWMGKFRETLGNYLILWVLFVTIERCSIFSISRCFCWKVVFLLKWIEMLQNQKCFVYLGQISCFNTK